MSIEIRALTADDDLDPDLDLARRAFGPFAAGETERRLASARLTVGAGRHVAAFDGTSMVASARYFDMRQWWQGRSLPMAGIAGVKVAPEERGRGVGRALMTGVLEQAAARGYPLAALYPATSAVYRSLGWEMAGAQYDVTIPARALFSLLPPDPAAGPGADRSPGRPVLRRAGAADAASVIAVQASVYAATRASGPATFDVPHLAHELGDEGLYTYLADDGLLVYRWDRSAGEVLVYCAMARSARTTRALWSVVASHASVVERIRAFVDPADPVTWLVREPDVTLTRRDLWMLRLLDAPAAIAGRGFPAGARVAAPLTVTDQELPGNAGQWTLEVSGGKGVLHQAETDSSSPASSPAALRLGARGLAALYAGTPLATLRLAGLAAGGDDAGDAALDEAFAGTPYMLIYF